jgi:hypothetical protein
MKGEPPAVGVTLNFVFDLGIRDRIIARDADISGPIASGNVLRHQAREPPALDELPDAHTQGGVL